MTPYLNGDVIPVLIQNSGTTNVTIITSVSKPGIDLKRKKNKKNAKIFPDFEQCNCV